MNEHDDTAIEQSGEVPAVADTQPLGATAMPTMPVLPPQYSKDDDTTRSGSGATAAASAGEQDLPVAARRRRSPRTRTVVFGLVMLAISVVSLVALVTDVRMDGGIVGLGLLIGAGAALVAGGVGAAVREARGGPGAAH